ncbi:MAG: acyl-CoA thioesterase, partial [Anaerolineae bacterium]|nr:acyl-CoA thioesterase [Anaerolineae bacterium]
MNPDPDLSLFRFSHPVEVRYADCDMLQHVNNARYFSYMEVARVWYYRSVLDWRGDARSFATILARAECDFRQPLVLGDTAQVYMRTARIGTKSYDFEYAITRDSD